MTTATAGAIFSPRKRAYIYIYIYTYTYFLRKAMANYPQELAQGAVCQSHNGHMTGLLFLPARPLRLNTNEWNSPAKCLVWKVRLKCEDGKFFFYNNYVKFYPFTSRWKLEWIGLKEKRHLRWKWEILQNLFIFFFWKFSEVNCDTYPHVRGRIIVKRNLTNVIIQNSQGNH